MALLLSAWCFSVTAFAVSTTLWSGSKQFRTSWNDVVNIAGAKFLDTQVGDVLVLSIDASSGAKLQISYGSQWKNFDGLASLEIGGCFNMFISESMLSCFQEGIHIKGVNYKLTQVSILHSDQDFMTKSDKLFAWDKMIVSGAEKGSRGTVGIKERGGIGWYWPDEIDMSGYKQIDVEMQQEVLSPVIVQILYGEKSVLASTIEAGEKSCSLLLSSQMKNVYSLNIMSASPQAVLLAQVNLLDNQGNPVVTSIQSVGDDAEETVTYFSINGKQIECPVKGVNIMRIKTKSGKTVVKKVLL